MKDWTTEGMSQQYIEKVNEKNFSKIMEKRDSIESKIRNHFRKDMK
jgi:hypothetical protein